MTEDHISLIIGPQHVEVRGVPAGFTVVLELAGHRLHPRSLSRMERSTRTDDLMRLAAAQPLESHLIQVAPSSVNGFFICKTCCIFFTVLKPEMCVCVCACMCVCVLMYLNVTTSSELVMLSDCRPSDLPFPRSAPGPRWAHKQDKTWEKGPGRKHINMS